MILQPRLPNMSKRRSTKIALGVNIDHAATLRQVRGGHTTYPDLHELTRIAKRSGASQITIHLREDRRHIQDSDVVELCRKRVLPINLELAPTRKMLKQVLPNRPNWICFVPEKRQELTTEGGLNVKAQARTLEKLVELCHRKGILVSMFIEADIQQVEASFRCGADAVEFHTGAWVESTGAKKHQIWKRLVLASRVAHSLGLRVHAGHGLDLVHTRKIRKLPHLVEVNIGHSIICYSLSQGFAQVLKKFQALL